MPALPPGFLVNSTGIEGSIDRIDNEPLDQADIAKLWKVYTITQRRLLDPTAERLENLWWRIWGSRKKQLKGAVVARLFGQISDGQSFVPLRGPSSDFEGTPAANTSIRHGPGASSTTALHRQNQSRPSTTSSSTASKAPVPMPHPILKKTRGPSTTGPRPTARFISPHESQDDSDQTSSVSPNAHVVVQPPSGPPSPSTNSHGPKSDKKSSKKKASFVASTGKKRRPMIVRRQSSQTSQSSAESPARNYDIAQAGMSTQSSSEKTPPSFAEQSHKSESRFRENFSPASKRSAATKKSMRKRDSLRSSDAKSPSPRKVSREERMDMMREQEVAVTGDPGPSRQPREIENNQQLVQSPTAAEFDEVEVQRALLEEANARLEREVAATETSTQEARYPSRALQQTLRSKSKGKLTSKGKGIASLAPTLTAVSGQMNLGDTDSSDAPPKPRSSSASLAKGKNRDPGDMRRAEMFTKRPVPPVQSAAAPDATDKLSRSKSQLTLLLERDRARSGERKVEKGKGKGKGGPKGGA